MALENNTNVVTVSGLARVVEGIRGWVENSAAAHSAYRVHSAKEWAIIFAEDPEAPDLGNYVFDAKYVDTELKDIKESVVEVASATSADMEVIAAALNDLDDRINATSGKADKVTGATSGHLAMLDSYGDLEDSGIPVSSVSGALERLSEIEPGAQVNVIESVKLGFSELTPESKVVTIPLFNGSVNGAVVAPTSANQNASSFLSGMGDWNILTPVTNAEIDEMFIENVVKIGGRNYSYVKIGNQLWLAENLDYAWEGLPVNSNGSSSSPMAYYYNRGNKSTYGIDGTYKCGLLYNHPAVDYLQANRATLLPEGWHVPTLTEWQTLINFVGGLVEANTKLKALPLSVTDSYPPNTWNGTDNYQLNILPVGFMDNNLTAQSINRRTGFWTQDSSGNSNKSFVDFDTETSSAGIGSLNVLYDMSLRLVKDVT